MKNDLLALIITFASMLIWLRANDYVAHRGWISSQVSRKIIHIGTGPLFILYWLLYPNSSASRHIASLVPLAITLHFFLVGIGVIRDQAAVRAMSRSGDPREILLGPLYYGIIFVICTIVYWYDSPIGIVALMQMCGGDGLADLLGRKFGQRRIPWNPQKTWIGSLGMFLGGFLLSLFIILVYVNIGVFTTPIIRLIPTLLFISVAATFVETMPLHNVDNITVTLTAIILGSFLF